MASALSPFMQQSAWPRLPSDQQSKDSEVSSKTIQRPSSCKPSHGSARSLGSSTSNKFCAGNENKVASRRTSHCSLPLATTSINFSLLQRTTKEASPKQSWENDVPLPYDAHGWSSPLPDVRLLEDIDLHAESGADRKYSGYDIESDHVDKADYGSSLDIKKRPSIFIPRLPRNTSGEETEPRPFVVATDHPFKTETNLKNWISTLRPQGPKRKGSLKVRKERWTLDDFDEEKPVELGLPQRRQLNGHQKASSWSSSGLLTALKSATVRHGAPKTKPQTAISPRSHFKGSNRSSIASDAAHRASIGSGQASSRQLDHAAWDRAVQRRKILEELVSSEESYVADLKVLLHVGSPNDLVQEVRATDEGSKVYLNLLESTPKMTQPELSQNVADMLRLHEEILAQIKRCLPDADLQSDISVEAQEKSKIGRWGNVDNAEAPMGRKVVRMAWRSHDLFWFGHHKNRTLVTAPGEAADVARIFERMVRSLVFNEQESAETQG